jgi:YidC/Oxa1 family membrane protein insertase
MEERRLLVAVALSLLVLTAYQMLFPSKPAPGPTPAPAASLTPAASAPPTAAPTASPSPAGRATPRRRATPSPAPVPAPAVADDRERRVEVAGPDFTIAFANRGARLISWQLMGYRDARSRPEEMVPAVRDGVRALDLETGQADVDARLRDALFKASSEQVTLGSAGGELSFHYADGDLVARKSVRFPARGYMVQVSASVTRAGQAVPVKVLWGPGVGNPSAAEQDVQGYLPPQAVYRVGEGVERVPAEAIGALRSLPQASWVGVESTYFAALFIPPSTGGAEVRAVGLPPGEDGKPRMGPVAAVTAPGAEAPALLYVGPKDYQVLETVGHGLKDVVPVGEWIGFIVVPFMRLLRWVHGLVGNYGWAIVLLTVVINLLMAPLRHFSIANGLKMAKMAPEMRVIQDRYRKVPLMDPRRQDMQQEIAELYERHGMSMGTQMLVGCLPLLLTMPFLIAFYRVLQVSIELRGAHFLWLSDLSQKDPYFVMPVLMGLSMFWMQKMMPTGMDPAQQKIMLIMPAVLSVMFLWAPGGLNLYWLASNLCSIVQQTVTLRLLKAREAEAGPRRERKK